MLLVLKRNASRVSKGYYCSALSILGLILLLSIGICSLTINTGAFYPTSKASVRDPLYLGVWINGTDSAPGTLDGDRPYLIQERTELNFSIYQFGQFLPLDVAFPLPEITALHDDSIVLMTVMPVPDPWSITDNDINDLALQIQDLYRLNRRIFLRFAHEMNGYWNVFGISPTRYIPLWKRVYTAVKQKAPLVHMIWAPNAANGWPYGYGKYWNRSQVLDVDFDLMDTNGNGIIDEEDDPFLPFYPGDEYVDM